MSQSGSRSLQPRADPAVGKQIANDVAPTQREFARSDPIHQASPLNLFAPIRRWAISTATGEGLEGEVAGGVHRVVDTAAHPDVHHRAHRLEHAARCLRPSAAATG